MTEDRNSYPYAREVISSAIDQLRKSTTAKYASRLRPWLPYVFFLLKNGRYLPVNRDYKPLGLLDGHWIKYGAFPWLEIDASLVDLSKTAITPKNQFARRDPSVAYVYPDHAIYLFWDACPPWEGSKEKNLYISKVFSVLPSWEDEKCYTKWVD